MTNALLTLKTCPFCSALHESFFSVCTPCLEAAETDRIQEKKRQIQQEKAEKWLELCPEIYRTTDWKNTADYPDLNPNCAHIAATWLPADDGMGLGLHGKSGIGKTRAMWTILKRLHFSGRKVVALDAIALEQAAVDRHHATVSENHAARRLIDRAKNAGILYLDDIGKEKASPSVAKVLHDILETRTRAKRVTLWTSERVGHELALRFGTDYGDGMVRRLREFSHIPEIS